MSRREKWVGALLGALVFAGLFYFIFASMKASPAFPEPDDAAFDDYDFTIEGDTEPVEDLLPTAPPAPAAPAPVKAPAAPAKPKKR